MMTNGDLDGRCARKDFLSQGKISDILIRCVRNPNLHKSYGGGHKILLDIAS